MQKEIAAFLVTVLGERSEGWLCISTKDRNTGKWVDNFYTYPGQLNDAVKHCMNESAVKDVYFCTQLLNARKVEKENCKPVNAVWSDLDTLDISELHVDPSIVIQSSPGRTQAYWLLSSLVDPEEAESIAHGIAYAHRDGGADVSGWDLTQRLRIPQTFNHKYQPPKKVKIVELDFDARYKMEDFRPYFGDNGLDSTVKENVPQVLEDPDDIVDHFKTLLNPRAFDLYQNSPSDDVSWSELLWALELMLFESGMDKKQVFAVVKNAACNKYRRDTRKDSDLWKEVNKAYSKVQKDSDPTQTTFFVQTYNTTNLLTDENRKTASKRVDFISEYIEWATQQSDAASQYHQAGAFIVLSTLLSGAVRLPMSFGIMQTNLWFMILADTTLTRKSTAMDLATDLLTDVDSEAILATDGSIEGLLTSLSTRPGRPSLFLRDEVTGLIQAVAKKDYYAGMLEALTKLYDAKRQKRILRKETIDLREPIFNFFAGGIKSKMMEVLSYEHVSSGFLPRFCFITAESDPTKMKPIGPPSDKAIEKRNLLQLRLIKTHRHYWTESDKEDKITHFSLSDDAWVLYNRFEYLMTSEAVESVNKDVLVPVMSRLAISGLKAAVLLAAYDKETEITEEHLYRAFFFVEQWREHALEVVMNVGSSSDEQRLAQIMSLIRAHPGIPRAELMRVTKLRSNEMNTIVGMLDEREMIRIDRRDKKHFFYPNQSYI